MICSHDRRMKLLLNDKRYTNKMNLGTVKNLVGFNLLGLHCVAIFLCFYWLDERLSPQDFRIVILILCPVTAVYAMAFVRELVRNMFVDNPDAQNYRKITNSFSLTAVAITMFFSFAIIYNIFEFQKGGNMSSDDLKDRLGIIETVLGGFLGLIVETLFGKSNIAPGEIEKK